MTYHYIEKFLRYSAGPGRWCLIPADVLFPLRCHGWGYSHSAWSELSRYFQVVPSTCTHSFLQDYDSFLSKPINHIWSILVLLYCLGCWSAFDLVQGSSITQGDTIVPTLLAGHLPAKTACWLGFGVGSDEPLLQSEHELSTFIALKKVLLNHSGELH